MGKRQKIKKKKNNNQRAYKLTKKKYHSHPHITVFPSHIGNTFCINFCLGSNLI